MGSGEWAEDGGSYCLDQELIHEMNKCIAGGLPQGTVCPQETKKGLEESKIK